MADLPPVTKCSFCGEDAKLLDRRVIGLRLILAGFLVAFLTGWYFDWMIAAMDWVALVGLGCYWLSRSDRFIYRCKCTNVIIP